MILLQKIKEHCDAHPSKVAIIEGDRCVTYAELWKSIIAAACYFRGIGNSGERVVLSGSKKKEFIYCYFGAHLAGLTTVTIDPAINEERLNYIVEKTKPLGIWGDIISNSLPVKDFNEIVCTEHLIEEFPDENQSADILFTTGTTGLPKGVVLTHRNEWAAATNINTFIGNDADSIELLALPISHSFGLGRLRCIMQLGATIDLLGSFANVRRFFQEIERHHVTGFGMVPASWNYLTEMSDDMIGDYAHLLKYVEIGSANMPLEQKQRLLRLLPNTRICMHYGLTEASRSAFMCFNDESDLTTIGHAAPNVDIKIFSENGQECAQEEEGEICVKGDHVCTDYWGKDHAEYLESFYGDYYRTGDWGVKKANNKIYLVSRKKELINVGGKKVSPLEVETVLNSHPLIKESACVGIPDAVLGEVVKAFVITQDGQSINSKDIIKYVSARIENYKVPYIIKEIDRIPKTDSGKIQRLLLKDHYHD